MLTPELFSHVMESLVRNITDSTHFREAVALYVRDLPGEPVDCQSIMTIKQGSCEVSFAVRATISWDGSEITLSVSHED